MKEKIRNILFEIFETEIDDNFSKYTTDEWDSLAHLNLLVRIEQEFNISFTPEEIGNISSFIELVNVVEQKYEK